jgi:hypothetical protein
MQGDRELRLATHLYELSQPQYLACLSSACNLSPDPMASIFE